MGSALAAVRRFHGKAVPGAEAAGVTVVYNGPFEQVADESGRVYRRGEKTTVPAPAARLLRVGPVAEQFAFLA